MKYRILTQYGYVGRPMDISRAIERLVYLRRELKVSAMLVRWK